MPNRLCTAAFLCLAFLSPAVIGAANAGELAVTPRDFGLEPGAPAPVPADFADSAVRTVAALAAEPRDTVDVAGYDRIPVVVTPPTAPTTPQGPEFTNTTDLYGTVPVVVNTDKSSTPVQTTLGTLNAAASAYYSSAVTPQIAGSYAATAQTQYVAPQTQYVAPQVQQYAAPAPAYDATAAVQQTSTQTHAAPYTTYYTPGTVPVTAVENYAAGAVAAPGSTVNVALSPEQQASVNAGIAAALRQVGNTHNVSAGQYGSMPITINAPIMVNSQEEAERAARAVSAGVNLGTGAFNMDVPVTMSPDGQPNVASFVVPVQIPLYIQNASATPTVVQVPTAPYAVDSTVTQPLYYTSPEYQQPNMAEQYAAMVQAQQQQMLLIQQQQLEMQRQQQAQQLEIQRQQQMAAQGQYQQQAMTYEQQVAAYQRQVEQLRAAQSQDVHGMFDPFVGGATGGLPAQYRPMAATPGETNEFLDFTSTPSGSLNLVTPAQVKEAISRGTPMILLDVRAELVRDVEGHLTGDVNVPFEPKETFAQRVAQLIPNRGVPVIVYCHDGIWSSQAGAVLLQLGYRPFLMGAYRLWFG